MVHYVMKTNLLGKHGHYETGIKRSTVSAHLDELRIHELGRAHTRPLVHLAVIDELLAAIHRLIV